VDRATDAQGDTVTLCRLFFVLAFGLLQAGCATSSSFERTRTAPDLGPVKGGIAWLRHDDYLLKTSVWNDGAVVAGPRGGPAIRFFTRGTNGKWTGPGPSGLDVDFTCEGSRITGTAVDVNFTRVEGGFRLTGLWFGRGVDLLVNGKVAVAEEGPWVRDPSGAYVSKDFPYLYLFLIGDAARLDDPPWPEMALAALAGGWGVQ